jgi:tetratricopeptide (TPR) repeat protein
VPIRKRAPPRLRIPGKLQTLPIPLKNLLFSLFWRLLPAGVLILLGASVLLATGPGGAFIGFGLFLIASILLAFPLANLLAAAWDRFLWSKSYYDKPQPMYGIPQSRRAKGHPEEALAEYEKIAAAYPNETRPWLDMVAIAIEDLKDAQRAQVLFERGIALLNNPDDKDLLARTYSETRTRLDIHPPHAPVPLPAKRRNPDGDPAASAGRGGPQKAPS